MFMENHVRRKDLGCTPKSKVVPEKEPIMPVYQK